MGYKEKEMTAEMLQKREERARKRRLQAAKKAEENKNQTIERLTKTSKAKIKSMKERKSKQTQVPMVRYNGIYCCIKIHAVRTVHLFIVVVHAALYLDYISFPW